MRQIVLDIETTGISPSSGHRITEIGCIELIDRKLSSSNFHHYINPERELDEGAARITGLSWAKLRDKPKFAEIVEDFVEYVQDAELIIHNAPFDLGFITHELTMLAHPFADISERLSIIDTLKMARDMYPGQKNNLDALAKRLNIDNSHRVLHGALLDASITAEVYLRMTSGQELMDFEPVVNRNPVQAASSLNNVAAKSGNFKVRKASSDEQRLHQEFITSIEKST